MDVWLAARGKFCKRRGRNSHELLLGGRERKRSRSCTSQYGQLSCSILDSASKGSMPVLEQGRTGLQIGKSGKSKSKQRLTSFVFVTSHIETRFTKGI